jgi:HEAT repeat protein
MQQQKMILGLLILGSVAAMPLAARVEADRPAADDPAGFRTTPPDAWLATDQADSLYREARQALNRGDYQRAAGMFRDIRSRYPDSGYTPDSFYWEAFSLYRMGSSDRLRRAADLLTQQARAFPDANTRRDADELMVRIQGELGRRGDAQAAETVVGIAVPAPPVAPADRAVPVPGAPPAPPRGVAQGQEQEEDIRVAALNALMQMDAERAIPILKQVLERRDEGSVELRRKAVFIVSQHDTEETAEILLDVVRNDPDSEVRAQAVFWLSQVPTDEAVVALDSILQHSTDRQVQEKAIFALSQHEGERADQALRSYVQRTDTPEDLRHNAIFWLGQSGSRENMEFLKQLYDQLQSDRLKERVIFALSQGDYPEEQAEWLMGIALTRNESMEMRKKALFWAGQMDEVNIGDLAELYDTMDDREMREQLVFTLSQRDEPAAIDKLIEIARSDPDEELRRKAIFWLGQSEDPRVAEVLLQIINEGGQ